MTREQLSEVHSAFSIIKQQGIGEKFPSSQKLLLYDWPMIIVDLNVKVL